MRLATATERRIAADVHLCNAYTLALADKHAGYRQMLRHAALNLPDGKSVVWADRFLRRGRAMLGDRVRGADLFWRTFEVGQRVGLRHYLLGSTPEVLRKLGDNVLARYPLARIVGVEAPPFRELTSAEESEQIERIRGSGAQIVWVGLGTPRQDWESARLSQALPGVCVAVGAAFDFIAGTKKQAPVWMRQAGLEWAHRLMREPRRLWRRYLFGNLRFVYAACRHRG